MFSRLTFESGTQCVPETESRGRIRTYNYPQGRITDHRINLTLYKLEQIMGGDMNELIDALLTHQQAKLLAAN